MFIHPLGKNTRTTVSNLNDDCIQPNAVDLEVAKMFKMKDTTPEVMILKNKTVHGEFEDVHERLTNKPNHFRLEPGCFYQFETNHYVEIGEGEVGWIIGRSSLIRNGMMVTSGVYDAGFRGNVGGVIFNLGPYSTTIEVGARIGQLLLAESDSVKKYEGQYQDTGVVNVK